MANIHVITGGSGGIGLECAKQFKGDTVLIADINEQALANGKSELSGLGINAETIVCDVTNEEQIAAMAKKATELGTIKSVIHTAGVSNSVNNLELIMKIDLVGTENIIEGFLPYMGKGSSMTVVASMMGHTVPPNKEYDDLMLNCKQPGFYDKIIPFLGGDGAIAYNFAKRGVILLVGKWRNQYGEVGARINSISPGIIETPMAKKAAEDHPEAMQYMQSLTAMKRNGLPEDIALPVKFLSSDDASFITGTDLLIDGGLIKNFIAAHSGK